MTNNEITEAYFVARGWKSHEELENSGSLYTYTVFTDEKGRQHSELPNILESFPDFKREVLEVMEGEGFTPQVYTIEDDVEIDHLVFTWYPNGNLYEEIKDNEILKAAVLAATRYWESKENAEGS